MKTRIKRSIKTLMGPEYIKICPEKWHGLQWQMIQHRNQKWLRPLSLIKFTQVKRVLLSLKSAAKQFSKNEQTHFAMQSFKTMFPRNCQSTDAIHEILQKQYLSGDKKLLLFRWLLLLSWLMGKKNVTKKDNGPIIYHLSYDITVSVNPNEIAWQDTQLISQASLSFCINTRAKNFSYVFGICMICGEFLLLTYRVTT